MTCDWVQRLRAPSTRHRVRFAVHERCFVRATAQGRRTRFRGVLPTLRLLFCASDEPPTPMATARGARAQRTARGTGRGGTARGRLVDRQLAVAVTLLRESRHAWSVRDLVGPTLPAGGGAPTLRARLRRWRATLHPYARAVLTYLDRQGWEPVGAQVPVACGPWRLATAVDLVCVRREALARGGGPGTRLALFEIKTGYRGGGYDGPTSQRLRAPFDAWPDTHRHRHQLQWLATRLLFDIAFRARRWHAEGGVLRVDDDGVHPVVDPSEQNVQSALSALRSALQHRCSERRRTPARSQ